MQRWTDYKAALLGALLAVGTMGATLPANAQATAAPLVKAAPTSDMPRALPPAPPPQGAAVLFDGKDLSAWTRRSGDGDARWRIEEGAMISRGGDIVTRRNFRDFRLHVEFNVPAMPEARGQARGNSGVYLLGRYEVQVLDSYGPAIEPPGRPLQKDECGAIYEQAAPRVNATLPPGAWQTYDIWFRAPRLAPDGSVREKPRITVIQNGIKIHNNVAVDGATRAGMGDPRAAEGPVMLQDHGNPVRYRNVWLVPM